MKRLEIYTDGACDNVCSRIGGWAWVMLFNGKHISRSRRVVDTTSNRMEMEGIIQALESYQNQTRVKVDEIVIYSDSEYSINMLSGRWRVRVNTKNQDLIRRFQAIQFQIDAVISFKKVKAHSGDRWNEVADSLANQAMSES
jgi:ribonuclease HI